LISPIIYLRIRTLLCDNPFLPGLKAIYIFEDDPDNNPVDPSSMIFLVSGASLDVVELHHSAMTERNFFIPFMSSLASKSPKLAHLALRGSGNISLEPVYRLRNLRHLEILLPYIYLYPQTVRRLGDMVNLLDLTLNVGASTPEPDMGQRLPISSPPSSKNSGRLRRLHIIGAPSSITRVLDDLNIASLTTLVIDETCDTFGQQTERFWKRCFDQVSGCQAIENIEINQLHSRSWGHPYYSLSTSWFSSLVNLSNLKSLVINGSALSGSDEDFRLLACAFPKLEKLVVPPEYYSQGRTLACLYHFSRHCPNLSEIKICIGFDIHKNLDAIKELPHPISANLRHPLKKLYIKSQYNERPIYGQMQLFGQMQPTHFLQVAQFLDLLFPHLSVLEAYDSLGYSYPTGDNSNLIAIQQILLALGATRTNALQYFREMSEGKMESNN
jgi:hypothetical protein